MPIIIRELVITMTVDANAQTGSPAAAPAPGQAQQQVVADCVAQVLAILAEKEER